MITFMLGEKYEFDRSGITLIDHYLMPDSYSDVVRRFFDRKPDGHQRDGVTSQGQPSKYLVLDTSQSVFEMPFLETIYTTTRHLVEGLVGRPTILSPHPNSAINLKCYYGPEGQGAHYDSQPISVLIFLAQGAPLMVQAYDSIWRQIDSVPGRLVVFKGRENLHYVPFGSPGDFRMSLVLNYYHPDDTFRPDGLDAAIYDNQPVDQLNGSTWHELRSTFKSTS